MRAVWSTLVVLVLLAPFGRIGITATAEVDAVTIPSTRDEARSVPEEAAQFVLVPPRMCIACFLVPRPTFVASTSVEGLSPSVIESLAITAPSARGPPA